MKRTVGALGLLGLLCAVSLPAAHAAALVTDDFSTDKLLKDPLTYMQGFGTAQVTAKAAGDPAPPHSTSMTDTSRAETQTVRT